MVLSRKVLSLPIRNQHLPFFPSCMNCILNNANPELLLKLYQCCKYFYCKSQITIASNVRFSNYSHLKKLEFMFYRTNGNGSFYHIYPNAKKLWLTNKLHIYASDNYGIFGNEFLNKIYRNNLDELSIDSGFTLFKELQILSNSPSLIKVELSTLVKNEDDKPIPMDEIMILFPAVKHFVICPSYFTLESFIKLSKFKFLNKINVLQFWMIKTEFDPKSLCDFLKDNFVNNADLTLTFGFQDLKLQLLPQVKEIIKTWETKKLKYFYT